MSDGTNKKGYLADLAGTLAADSGGFYTIANAASKNVLEDQKINDLSGTIPTEISKIAVQLYEGSTSAAKTVTITLFALNVITGQLSLGTDFNGDKVDVEGGIRIRLVLVDAPELSETGGQAARDYLTSLCLGKLALIDEDDLQVGEDPYGRVLAVVYCSGKNANAAMISSGYADTYSRFCSESEFGSGSWTGCSSLPPPPPPTENCDPAYPDVCIPPPPPDLDCGDIPYRNFRVLPPDPHHFDGDGDGIGCES